MKKFNYIVPYGRRFTRVGSGWADKETLMCIDGLGICVEHKRDYTPTADEVRQHLIGTNEQHSIIIQADSDEECLKIFFSFEQCRTGTKYRAWYLVDSERKPIIQYAGCQFMRMKHTIACAAYDEPTDEGHMICILDGLDEPPSECPIFQQMEKKSFRKNVYQMGGAWFQSFTKLTVPMEPQINGIILRKATV